MAEFHDKLLKFSYYTSAATSLNSVDIGRIRATSRVNGKRFERHYKFGAVDFWGRKYLELSHVVKCMLSIRRLACMRCSSFSGQLTRACLLEKLVPAVAAVNTLYANTFDSLRSKKIKFYEVDVADLGSPSMTTATGRSGASGFNQSPCFRSRRECNPLFSHRAKRAHASTPFIGCGPASCLQLMSPAAALAPNLQNHRTPRVVSHVTYTFLKLCAVSLLL